MKGNLLIIKTIFRVKHELKIKKDEKSIYNIFLISYIKACILKNTNSFTLSFCGKYIQSNLERLLDWFYYFYAKTSESFYKILGVIYNENLVSYKAHKPIHLKVSNVPDEYLLENFLKKLGFTITSEHVYSVITEYEIKRTI